MILFMSSMHRRLHTSRRVVEWLSRIQSLIFLQQQKNWTIWHGKDCIDSRHHWNRSTPQNILDFQSKILTSIKPSRTPILPLKAGQSLSAVRCERHPEITQLAKSHKPFKFFFCWYFHYKFSLYSLIYFSHAEEWL